MGLMGLTEPMQPGSATRGRRSSPGGCSVTKPPVQNVTPSSTP
jgi:hypothetical protein